jgi:hypothetical protein
VLRRSEPTQLTTCAAAQAASGALLGTAALACIAALTALRALFRAVVDALFVTLIIPAESEVRARGVLGACSACGERADAHGHCATGAQAYADVCAWLARRAEVRAAPGLLQYYTTGGAARWASEDGGSSSDGEDSGAEGSSSEDDDGSADGDGAVVLVLRAPVAATLAAATKAGASGGGGAKAARGGAARRLRARALPGASAAAALRLTGGSRAWVRRHVAPPSAPKERRCARGSDYSAGYLDDSSYEGGGDNGGDNARKAVHITLRRRGAEGALAALLAEARACGAARGWAADAASAARRAAAAARFAAADDDDAGAPAKPQRPRFEHPPRCYMAQWAADEGRWRWPYDEASVRFVALHELLGATAAAAAAVLKDARRFRASERWYAARGIPYRRGYLLHGPAGCGKTAIVLAVAGEMRLSVRCVDLLHPLMSDDGLATLFRGARSGDALLLRHLDRVFDERGAPLPGAPPGLSLSALQNVLDGVCAGRDGILVFATSRAPPQRLDAALVRPSRIDMAAHVPGPSPASGAAFFRAFYAAHPIHAPRSRGALDDAAAAFEAALERRAREAAGDATSAATVSMRDVVSYLTTRCPARAVADVSLLGMDALQVAARAIAAAAPSRGDDKEERRGGGGGDDDSQSSAGEDDEADSQAGVQDGLLPHSAPQGSVASGGGLRRR